MSGGSHHAAVQTPGREFKSHFRFRGLGTVYQLWYKSTCGLGTAEPGAASILKVYRREGSMSGCELCCAPKSGMAPRRPFSY